MESVYWVLCWACHRRCRHCYDDRFRPYTHAALEAVVAQGEAAVPRIVANLPAGLDRIVLAGGEVLLDGVRQRVLFPAMAALRARYGAATRIVVQTTGDLVTPERVGELLERGAWMISVSGLDDFHVGQGGAAGQALRARLGAMFAAAGMRPSGYTAPLRGWQQEEGPVFGFFGATPEMWIGKLWPRGRAWTGGLSTATATDNFCARWSGGLNFLAGGAGAEVAVEPDGAVYPCCIKTKMPLGTLVEERLDDILASLRGHPAFQAIDAGEPERMGETLGWSVERFRAESVAQGGYANPCIGCDRVHEAVLGRVIADLRAARMARAAC